MKLPNIRSKIPYWDECNKNNVEWFMKGWYKKYFRKKKLKEYLKERE